MTEQLLQDLKMKCDESAWVGFDLDGTLAKSRNWQTGIGEPVPAMVNELKSWLARGVQVKIFTARVTEGPWIAEQTALIEGWCAQHLGVVLPITNVKDLNCIKIYDDIAEQVFNNTGMTASKLIDHMNKAFDQLALASLGRNDDPTRFGTVLGD